MEDYMDHGSWVVPGRNIVNRRVGEDRRVQSERASGYTCHHQVMLQRQDHRDHQTGDV